MLSPLMIVSTDTAIGVCAYCVPSGDAMVVASPSAVKPITTTLPITALRSSVELIDRVRMLDNDLIRLNTKLKMIEEFQNKQNKDIADSLKKIKK